MPPLKDECPVLRYTNREHPLGDGRPCHASLKLGGSRVGVRLAGARGVRVAKWIEDAGGVVVADLDEGGLSVVVTDRVPQQAGCAVLLVISPEQAEALQRLPAWCVVCHPPLSRMNVLSNLRALCLERSAERMVASAQQRWSLSQRQVQLLELTIYGYSDQEIASSLGLTCATIQTYQKNLRRRTGATSRQEYIRLIAGIPGGRKGTLGRF